jgi:hypothetical protein
MVRRSKAQIAVDEMEAKASKEKAPEPAAIRELRHANEALRRKLTAQGGQGDLILEAVRQSFDGYEPPTIPPAPKPSKRPEREAVVLHLSDTQFGKVTKSYDSEVASRRVAEFAERACKIIERHRAYAQVDEAHIYLGGDMIEGELIFPGQAHLIDQSVFDQAVRTCPDACAKLILRIAREVQSVRVVCVAGNHGRPGSKHAGSHPRTNWDRVVYETARLMVEGIGRHKSKSASRIAWDIADDFYAVNDVLGHRHLVVHGHQIRGGFGGFPFYGTAKKAWGWIDSIDEEWQHLYFGHFHCPTTGNLNGRWWFCNGSTESDNEYAREELSASGVPIQRMQFWSEKHGLVADSPIYLTYGMGKRRA